MTARDQLAPDLRHELRYLAYRCRVEAAERWGVRGSADVARSMALRVVGESVEAAGTFPPAEEARRVVADEGRMAGMTPRDRLMARMACEGDGYYTDPKIVGTFQELAGVVVEDTIDRMERNPPPPLDGMRRARGPRRRG